jgi:hypothetical protein
VNSIVAIFWNFAIAPDCLLMDHRIGRIHPAAGAAPKRPARTLMAFNEFRTFRGSAQHCSEQPLITFWFGEV